MAFFRPLLGFRGFFCVAAQTHQTATSPASSQKKGHPEMGACSLSRNPNARTGTFLLQRDGVRGSPLFPPDFGQNALLSWEFGEAVLPAQMSQKFKSLNILSCQTDLTTVWLERIGGEALLLQGRGALSLPGRSVLDPQVTEWSAPAGSPLLTPWGSASRSAACKQSPFPPLLGVWLMVRPDRIESLIKQVLHRLASNAEFIPNSVTVECTPSPAERSGLIC